MLKGIDVSEHQGQINWNKVKGQIDFVILRAGYGHNNIDKQFVRNIEECNRLGIPVGIYWFSYAYNCEMAKNEAIYAIQAIKNYKVEYPIIFDFEYDTINYANKNGIDITKRLATDMVNAFCEEIEKNKYYAMNYSNKDFINSYFIQEELNKYALWYAYYNNELDREVGIWQYSESGKIDGINTNSVDMNYSYIDYKKIIHKKELNNISDLEPIKILSKNNSNEIVKELFNQRGICTIEVDKLNIREFSSTNSRIVGSYTKGEIVTYDKVVYTNQYAWISWIGKSGNRRYMAVRDRNTNCKLGHCV